MHFPQERLHASTVYLIQQDVRRHEDRVGQQASAHFLGALQACSHKKTKDSIFWHLLGKKPGSMLGRHHEYKQACKPAHEA